uniref:SMC5-SMC6 complex localization factor protein 1 n=1 Tax=Pristiophorus japonicus TaxID=55135 RepID=UPI00398F206B
MAGLVQKPVIQLTGFKHSEKGAIVKLLIQLDCIYFHEQEYKQQCTHMIANKPSQSEKFLAACAAGKWVLTKDYIIDSAKNGRWLNEMQYEWGYKIQSNSLYPTPMDSVPKIWREELARSGIPGVFHNWKVVLLISDETRKATFKRVLHAGKAAVYHRPRSSCEITHVLTESKNYTMERLKNTYKAPYFPVEYIGQFILKPLCSKRSNEDLAFSYANILDVDHLSSSSFLDSTFGATQILREIKSDSVFIPSNIQSNSFKHRLQMCLSSPETVRSKYVPSGMGCCLYTSTTRHHQIRVVMFPGVTINRIEGILEGQFYMEALKEIRFHLSSKFFPPAHLLQSLLQLILEGNVDMDFLHEFISIMQTLVLNHPPWQQSSIVSYYMGILQCSNCRKGGSFLLESLARSCVYDEEPCHQPSNQELSISELKPIYRLLLKYFLDLFESELEAVNKSCYENTNFGCSRIIPPSVLAKFFLEYSDVMTNPVAVLLDCVLQATKTLVRKPNDKAFCETAYILHGILGVVVEYRLLVNRLRGKSLSGRAWDDLQFYIPICCQDYNQDEIEMLLKLIPSPWLKMFTAHAIYKQICYNNGIEITETSFSLHQIISSYLIALGRLGSCRKVMVKDPKGKKMGQWPWPEPLRPSLTLTGDRQKHVEALAILAEQNLPFMAKQNTSLEAKETKTGSCKINLKGEMHLHKSCEQDKVEELRKLLSEPGIDINVNDHASWTLLDDACNHGNICCVQEILHLCPEVALLSTKGGVTPLHVALINGHIAIAKLLIEHGGAVLLQQQDCLGKTPLDYIDCPNVKEDLCAIVEVRMQEIAERQFGNVNKDINPTEIEPSAYLWSILLKNYVENHNLLLICRVVNDESLNTVQFVSKNRFENLVNSFPDQLMVQYAEDLKAYKELPKYIQQVLANLRSGSLVLGVHTQLLLLHMNSTLIDS